MVAVSRQPGTRQTPNSPPRSTVMDQPALRRVIFLHLAPGAIFTIFLIVAAPVLDAWGIDPIFALFGGIGLVLVPLELGYLALHAKRTTGSWSPFGAMHYTTRVPLRTMVALVSGLVVWFLICLVVSVVFLDEWLAEHVFAWMPNALLQFAVVEEGDPITGWSFVAFALIAFAFNGVAGPITEEMYFRGHLLPRLEHYGRWAPVMNTALFTLYHFFSPWRYPAIFIGFLPITWMAWRNRSIFVSIAAHMTINMVAVLGILSAV